MAEVQQTMTLLTTDENGTPKGTILAYTFLTITALVTVFIGAARSANFYKELKQKQRSNLQADNFILVIAVPLLISSVFGFGAYYYYYYFDYPSLEITDLMTLHKLCLTFIATLAFGHLFIHPLLLRYCSPTTDGHYHIRITRKEGSALVMDRPFSKQGFYAFALSVPIGLWYLSTKHWIANNLLGVAFAVRFIETTMMPHLQHDVALIFFGLMWMICTFIPFNLVFPLDILSLQNFFSPGAAGSGDNFAMLRFADIVVPGIFMAFFRRYDASPGLRKCTYFHTSFIAYAVGLLAAILSKMLQYRDVQPAFYLVPACFGAPLALALLEGELKALFQYNEWKVEENLENVVEKTEENLENSVGKEEKESETKEEESSSSITISPHYAYLNCQY